MVRKRKEPPLISTILQRKNNAAIEFFECLRAAANAYEKMMSTDEFFHLVDWYDIEWDDALAYIQYQTPKEIVDAVIVRRLQGVGARIDLDDQRDIRDVPRVSSLKVRVRRDNRRAQLFIEEAVSAARHGD